MKRGCPSQRGFAAIAAIFLVVVLAALGGFMLTFSNTQQLTSAQDVQGSRAYWAARAGLEWGIGRVLGSSVCAATTSQPIDGFSVVTKCAAQAYNEGGVTKTIYRFESTASAGGIVGGVGYVERSLSASLEL